MHGIGTSQQQQEDMLSSSGDGCSHLADEESDQEIPGGYSFKFQYFVNKPKCRPLILCKIHYWNESNIPIVSYNAGGVSFCKILFTSYLLNHIGRYMIDWYDMMHYENYDIIPWCGLIMLYAKTGYALYILLSN